MQSRQPIQVGEAVKRIMEGAAALGSERIPLEHSYGRILADPVIAAHDVPPFDRSPYDGFAIRSSDTREASGDYRIEFTVVDAIGAGNVSIKTPGEREAVRVMTGAQLPAGTDAVVMLEQTAETERGFTIRKPFLPQENVSLQGEDMRSGEPVLPAGTLIQPGVAALLATFGYAEVRVSRLPQVGILTTGSELLSTADPLQPGKIRDSNGPMIAAQLARMGIPYRMYKTAADRLDETLEQVRTAISETDALITTGGVSVGDFDYLPAVYKELGAEVLFNKVAMRPGSVTTAARLEGYPLFGLSGNPSACYVGFELFVRPRLIAMMGGTKPYLPRTTARLGEASDKANPFTRFIRAVYDGDTVKPAGFNKSNAVSSIARGNALIVLPGGTRGAAAGERVNVLLLGMEEGAETWTL